MVTRGPRSWPIAGTIGLAFGGLWALLGATGLPQGLRTPVESLSLLVTLALMAWLWLRREPSGPSTGLFRRRGYIMAVVLEVVAIYAASTLLTRSGLAGYVIPAVGAIVGLHFVGLWQATRSTGFLWIAGGMCAVSAIAASLPATADAFAPRTLLAGLGNALVLWIGAAARRST